MLINKEEIIAKWNAEMYDQHVTEVDDVDFILSLIGTDVKRVLEVACGSGRILVPLAKAGHDVVGMDIDQSMLDKLTDKAMHVNNIAYHRSDVINDPWGSGFDVVLLAANFLFNIVSDTDDQLAQKRVIHKSAQALVSGGHVFIDLAYTQHPQKWFDDPQDNVIWQGTDSNGTYGSMLLKDSTFDTEKNVCHFTRVIQLKLKDGKEIVHKTRSTKHFITLKQLHEWLTRYGFVIKKEYGDYQGNPISDTTNRAIIWAQKE
mgnify:CR=1 FL=1